MRREQERIRQRLFKANTSEENAGRDISMLGERGKTRKKFPTNLATTHLEAINADLCHWSPVHKKTEPFYSQGRHISP
jgi:hypothetical protein